MASLEAEVSLLSDPERLLAEGCVTPELEKLQAANSKLKFQITHLKRVSKSGTTQHYYRHALNFWDSSQYFPRTSFH